MKDPYQILGVPETATDEEVKKAYLQLARKYHPDNYHDNPLADLAQEKMKEINGAYEQITKSRSGGQRGSERGLHGGAGDGRAGNGLDSLSIGHADQGGLVGLSGSAANGRGLGVPRRTCRCFS